jgi:hypothetical protein
MQISTRTVSAPTPGDNAPSARARGDRPWDPCAFCTEQGEHFTTVVPDRQQPGRRVELCRACGGFLKTLDVELATPFPLVAIEDLASADRL